MHYRVRYIGRTTVYASVMRTDDHEYIESSLPLQDHNILLTLLYDNHNQ